MGGEADACTATCPPRSSTQLSLPQDREFLITTSVLDDVTAARAVALGESDAAARLASLRTRHLPVAWRVRRGHSLRCHARLREYLLERLERRGIEELHRTPAPPMRSCCRDEGHEEEAVEEFLRAGMPERAGWTPRSRSSSR